MIMVVGSRDCLSHGRAIWRDHCVRVSVYEVLIRGVPNAVIQESVVFMYCLLYAYGFTVSVVCGYERISREF